MSVLACTSIGAGAQSAPRAFVERRETWVAATLLLTLPLIYSANGRAIGSGDVVPAAMLSVALVRGDGLCLDRFSRVLTTSDGRLPGYVTLSRDHIISRYPVGPAIVALPFVAPQVIWLDWTKPGWESRSPALVREQCDRIGKNAALLLTTLAVVLVYGYLVGRGYGLTAICVAVTVAFGTGYFAVSSQALWQHGPAALCLTVALLALRHRSARAASLAGLATALAVVCRPIDAVFAIAIGAWVLVTLDRPLRWAFFAPACAVAVWLLQYNISHFDTAIGGYSEIEQMHPWAHGTRGTFTGSLPAGGLGTLLSPSHGLLVHWPWVGLALGAVSSRAVRQRFAGHTLELWLLAALVPTFLLLSAYSCWWAGHSFGPRFWIDAVPVFAIAAAAGVERAAKARQRMILVAFALCAAWAIFTNAVGFVTYPTSWHRSPTNVDRDHARLWDWRDNEITRGLSEGAKPRAW